MASQQATANLDYWLNQLGWEFSHPKIQAWLAAISKRANRQINSRAALTDYQCNRLARFLEIISECNRFLKHLQTNWNYRIVKETFTKHGGSDKMTIAGWEELYKRLDAEHKEYMPF